MLAAYKEHHDTPFNNSELLFIEQYDDVGGAMFMIEENNEIIATYGVLKITMDSEVNVAKLSRVHIRSDHLHQLDKFVDDYFDPKIYEWVKDQNIECVIKTVNEGRENVLLRALKRLPRKRLYGLNNINELGISINKNTWTILPYLILEKDVWQYCTYSSVNNTNWNKEWRKTKEIEEWVKELFNESFTSNEGNGWVI